MDLNKLISAITQSGLVSGLAGGAAAGAVTSALVSKNGRKHATTALKIGGLAAVGGLAWKAYQSYRDGRSIGSPSTSESVSTSEPKLAAVQPQRWQRPPASAFEIDDSEGSRGLLLMRAMIAAAKSDGHIDAEEKQRIFAKVETLQLSGSEKALLFDELSRPASIVDLVKGVNDMETAVELYAASLLAIDSSRPAGRVYLNQLSERLMLPAPLVHEIHAQAAGEDLAA